MGRYRVRVATGAWLFSGSLNRVRLWLVGAHREAKLELQLRPVRGKVSGQKLSPPPPQCPRWAWEAGKGQEARGCDSRTAMEFCGGTRGVRSTTGLGWSPFRDPDPGINSPRAVVNSALVVRPEAARSSSVVGAQ